MNTKPTFQEQNPPCASAMGFSYVISTITAAALQN